MQLGDVDAAIADFTQVLLLDPNHVKVCADGPSPPCLTCLISLISLS